VAFARGELAAWGGEVSKLETKEWLVNSTAQIKDSVKSFLEWLNDVEEKQKTNDPTAVRARL
jgi:pyridoxine/pyridoxamine 5'-phosphate oxidase